MIRKAIMVLLTLTAIGAAAVELWSGIVGFPVRVHLGRSDRGSERFVYFLSDSWFSTIGYSRLFIYESNGDPWVGVWDEESDAWFRVLCAVPLCRKDGRIVSVAREDDVYPSHVFQRALVVPRGLFFVVFATYPTAAFIRGPVLRWRRRRRGLCLKCGYDLTGNVSGVCPECGSELVTGRSC